MSSRYGSRKFILAAAVLASATVLVWFAKIADGVYSAVVLGVIAAYLTSNVVQKQVDKSAGASDTPAP
jgi:predicted PurR-regulated permease PerM